jgi:hypothetical protein
MDADAVSTAPWPGPGDSEGPVDPEGWAPVPSLTDLDGDVPAPLAWPVPTPWPVNPTPWPGPGDSEGPVSGD